MCVCLERSKRPRLYDLFVAPHCNRIGTTGDLRDLLVQASSSTAQLETVDWLAAMEEASGQAGVQESQVTGKLPEFQITFEGRHATTRTPFATCPGTPLRVPESHGIDTGLISG